MGETLDFFRDRLDSMIHLQHPLAVLGTRLLWEQIEAELAPIWERQSHEGTLQQSAIAELFYLISGGGGESAISPLKFPQREIVRKNINWRRFVANQPQSSCAHLPGHPSLRLLNRFRLEIPLAQPSIAS